MFRRLSVRAEAVGEEAQVVAEGARMLSRLFGKGKGKDGKPIKVMTADTRVQSTAGTVVQLSLGAGAKGRPIAWRVAYERVEHPIEDGSEDAVIEGEVEIAAGVLR